MNHSEEHTDRASKCEETNQTIIQTDNSQQGFSSAQSEIKFEAPHGAFLGGPDITNIQTDLSQQKLSFSTSDPSLKFKLALSQYIHDSKQQDKPQDLSSAKLS